MIALIELIFGSKVGRWIAEALIALLAVTGIVLYLEHRGAAVEVAKLQKSSVALVAKVTKENAATTKQYQAASAANEEKLHAALAANTALQSDLSQRVRDFDAYRRAHADVARPAGPAVAASGGECGALSCGDLASQLAVRGNELAGSIGELSDNLQSCERDRDSLTGLPP